MGTLNNKVAVITGASAGIGRAAAASLASRGACLVIGARRVDMLQSVREEITKQGGQCVAVQCDVGRYADVQQLFAAAIEAFGRVDIAIANAGFGLFSRVHETSDQQMNEIWQVNVLGTWYVMKCAAGIMLPRKSGHIIAVSSAIARRALPQMGPYAMTKAAQLSLVEAQRLELRPFGIYVSSVHPTSTATEFFEQAGKRSGRKMGGFGTMQSAAFVGEKIAGLVERPRPELWPHRPTRFGVTIAAALPSIADRLLARFLDRQSVKMRRSRRAEP